MELIEIYADEQYKDGLVDMLLEDGFDDFYYFSCHKYGATSMLLSEKEQVSGRKDFGLFRLFLDGDVAISVIAKLKENFGEEKIRIISYPSLNQM